MEKFCHHILVLEMIICLQFKFNKFLSYFNKRHISLHENMSIVKMLMPQSTTNPCFHLLKNIYIYIKNHSHNLNVEDTQ